MRLVEEDAERPEVRRQPVAAALHLLGREVLGRARERERVLALEELRRRVVVHNHVAAVVDAEAGGGEPAAEKEAVGVQLLERRDDAQL